MQNLLQLIVVCYKQRTELLEPSITVHSLMQIANEEMMRSLMLRS
jgi:hypothetical protein